MKTRSVKPDLLSGSAAAFAVSALLYGQAVGAFTLSNNPQFLPTPLPPNIAITLDDSGSMARAYAPDGLDTYDDTKRFKSSAFNPLYYNPDVVYAVPVDANGAPLTTSFTAAPINGFANGTSGPSSRGTVNLSTDYRPTLDYNPSSTSQNFAPHANVAADLLLLQTELVLRTGNPLATVGTSSPAPAYYYRFSALLLGCDGTTADEDCYSLTIVSALSGNPLAAGVDERQNFAIWYSFYRTRNLLTVSAAARAMSTASASNRVAWQALTTCTTYGPAVCRGWTGANVSSHIRRFDAAHKSDFYYWLFRLPANSGTPLRTAAGRAGAYFTTSGNNSPYGFDPNQSPPVTGTEYSCRPNFHILMTDGIWNSDSDTGSYCSGSTCGDKDGTNRTLPDGTSYDTSLALTSIYRGSSSNNVSDIAFHYWATDLRTDLANNQIPFKADRNGTAAQQYWNPKNDPATWQHLVTFTVGLGLRNTLNQTSPTDISWSGSTYAGAGYANLLSGAGSWPATGTNVSPGNVYDLWHAAINSRGQAFAAENPQELSVALATALTRIAERQSSAALAANSTRLSSNSQLYQARFNTGDWSGALTAFRINTDGTLGSVVWEATDPGRIPPALLRNIYSWSGSAGMLFNEVDLITASMWSYIGTPLMLAYLRGDDTLEQKNGGIYRNRSTKLGDIIDSSPVYVGTQSFGYTSLPEGSRTGPTPYNVFRDSKASRRKMLYVGSNAGMLHAFDADTGDERFAYVPQAVIPWMSQLSSPTYAHRFYVDGSPTTWDAFFGGAWKSVITGATGAGERSVFALDVTDPDSFSASKVLWEINYATPQRAGDAVDPQYAVDLGYTIGAPVVAKLNNGEWAAIFGNGYRSTNERGVLYIVRISDGTLIRKIDTGVGAVATPNGLGTPTLYDIDGDDVYDVVYAPDMRGNVWKFSLAGGTPSAWNIAFAATPGFPNGTPLFRARDSSGNVQPITARLELARPPTGTRGIIVTFGTGRFFADGDNINTSAQSFYGVYDNGTAVGTTNRSELVQQTITTQFAAGVPVSRTVTTNTVDFTTKRGYYLDLPASGERVVGTALIRAGRVIFTTVIPSSDPCDFGGSSWLMELDAASGAQLPYSVFDTNNDGKVDNYDALRAGVLTGVGVTMQVGYLQGANGGPDVKVGSGASGNIAIIRNRSTGSPAGRDSWRDLTR